jgi:hypothetical protein
MGIALYLLFYCLYFFNKFGNSLINRKLYNFSKKLVFNSSVLLIFIGSVYLINNFDSIVKETSTYIIKNSKGSKTERDSSLARLVQLNLAYENASLLGFGAKGQIDIIEKARLKAIDNYYVTMFLNTGAIGLILFILAIILIFNLIIKNLNIKILTPFLFFYLNYCIYVMILSIDHLMSLFFIFLGFLLILVKDERIKQ